MARECRIGAATVIMVAGCWLAPPGWAGEGANEAGGFGWGPQEPGVGKPQIFVPPVQPAVPTANQACPPLLPCGSQLIGTVRKDGSVELKVPAWRW